MPHPAAPASTAAEIVAPLMVRNSRPPQAPPARHRGSLRPTETIAFARNYLRTA